jgi:hypothetical protein
MSTPARAVTAGLVAVAISVAGCAHRTVPGRTVYQTVTQTPAPSTSAVVAPSTPPSSTSATPTPTHTAPPPPKFTRLTATCRNAMNLATVEKAIGSRLRGTTAYSVGRGDPTIGRLMYINCKYGVSRAKGAFIEISVSLYRSVGAAADRVTGTIQDFTSHGATSSGTKVAGRDATLLLGANMLAYGPTVVVHAGLRTIAVTLRGDTKNPTPTLRQVAALAVNRTGRLT